MVRRTCDGLHGDYRVVVLLLKRTASRYHNAQIFGFFLVQFQLDCSINVSSTSIQLVPEYHTKQHPSTPGYDDVAAFQSQTRNTISFPSYTALA
jgi:hypothetical protein